MPRLNTVDAVDYGLIGLYFVIIVWVGFYAAGKNRSSNDFFRAGGRVPWFMAGVSNWVSSFTAFMFVGAAGQTYRNGVSALLLFTSGFWAYLLGSYVVAPLWRRARLAAPLEFLTRRYSPSTTYFFTLTAIPIQILTLGAGLYTLCIFVSSALGFGQLAVHLPGVTLNGLQVCLLVIGAVVIVYSMAGGLWAAVLSDSVQGVIVIVMTVIILPVSLHYVGRGHGGGIAAGIGRVLRELPAGYVHPGVSRVGSPELGSGPLFLGAYIILNILLYNVSWHQAQRYNSVPTERDAGKMAMLCAWLSLIGPFLWVLPVLAAKLALPDMAVLWPHLHEPAEASFVSVALLLLPHGMIGFVVAAIISSSAGHANDTLNWLSAAIAKDVYVRWRLRLGLGEGSDSHQMRVAQLAMLAVGGTGVALALFISSLSGVFVFVLKFSSITIGCFYTPVLLGLLYRRTPWWSGLASCGAALAACLLCFGFDVFPGQSYARNLFSAMAASTVVFALSALAYREDDPRNAEIVRFDRDLRTPVEEPPGKGGGGELPLYAVIGNVSLILAVVMAVCCALPSTAGASSSINGIAALLLAAMGLSLRRMGRGAAPS